MAFYDDLTQDQKDILAAWERNLRGWINNNISRGIIEARALKASLDAAGGAGDILDSLDAGEIVPNSGGIAGAHDLTKEEWATLRSAGLNTFLTSYDTTNVRALAAKAAGPTAGL
jgi:hypothetical protein